MEKCTSYFVKGMIESISKQQLTQRWKQKMTLKELQIGKSAVIEKVGGEGTLRPTACSRRR